jgi:hypothetical protein
MIKFFASIFVWFAGTIQIIGLVTELIRQSEIPIYYNIVMLLLNFMGACYGIDRKDNAYLGMCLVVFILYLIHLIL